MNPEPIRKKIIKKASAMEIKVAITPQKFKAVPNGIYKAQIVDVREGIGSYGQNVYVFTFSILEGPYSECEIECLVNQVSNGVNGSLWKLIKGVLGIKATSNNAIVLGRLANVPCYIHAEPNGSSYGNKITEVISLNEYTKHSAKPSNF